MSKCPVLIVGGGGAGLTASMLRSRLDLGRALGTVFARRLRMATTAAA